MMQRTMKLVLGPPGTGKTTRLLDTVDRHIQDGVDPRRIAFVSFTKKAATEAATRAAEKFHLSHRQLTNFRTMHSLAFQSLGISRGDVMGRQDYMELARLVGVEFTGYHDQADGIFCATEGDMMLQMVGLAEARTIPLREVWEYCNTDISWHQLKQFAETINQYKMDTAKLDFSDMISNYTAERMLCDVDVAIIDEAQDLSNAQWDMAKVAFRGAKHIYLAGDDDQCLYQWSGANIERFMSLTADREVLPITYRLPNRILAITEAIAHRIKHRYKKEYRCVDDRPGEVHHAHNVDSLTITDGSWMLLARNSMFLKDYEEHCRQHGIPYTTKKGASVSAEHLSAIKAWVKLQRGGEITEPMHKLVHLLCRSPNIKITAEWHDALVGIPLEDREYYRSILRAGRKLDECRKVYIGTIHSVKGGEADHVAIRQDITHNTARGLEVNPDAEHRTFYVGASRPRKSLHVIAAETGEAYPVG